MLQTKVKPQLKIFLNNETYAWKSPPPQIANIYGIYLYDSSLQVHCASIMPSFECWFIEHYWVPDDSVDNLTREEWNEADDYVMSAFNEESVRYFSTNISNSINVEMPDLPFNTNDVDEVRDNMDEIIWELTDNRAIENIGYNILNN